MPVTPVALASAPDYVVLGQPDGTGPFEVRDLAGDVLSEHDVFGEALKAAGVTPPIEVPALEVVDGVAVDYEVAE